MKISPQNDWVLVRLHPVPQSEGNIILPHGGGVRSATVMQTGPGRRGPSGRRIRVDLKEGERVFFRREHLEHKQGQLLLAALGDDLGLLREEDVLFALPSLEAGEGRPLPSVS